MIEKFFKKSIKLFSRKKILVVSFQQNAIEMAYFDYLPWGFKLLAHGAEDLPPEGENNDRAIQDFIKDFLRKFSVRTREVVLNIADTDPIFIKHLDLPAVPDREIPHAAKWQLAEEAPFDMPSAPFDWQTVRSFTDDNGVKKKRIIFAAAKKGIIDHYLAILLKCRLRPIRVTSNPFNYARILKETHQKEPAIAILDVRRENSTINIYINNKLSFVRKIPISWDRLTLSLTKILGSQQGKVKISFEEAEEIMRSVGIPESEHDPVRDDLSAGHILSLMRPLLEALARELRFSFEYFSLSFETKAPMLLFVTGAGAKLKNLDKYLSKSIGRNVSSLPLPDYANTREMKEAKTLDVMANLLGACMRDFHALNLLPERLKAQQRWQVQKSILRLAVITIAAILLFVVSIVEVRVRDYTARLRNAIVHLAMLGRLDMLTREINAREVLMGKIQEGRVPTDGMLKIISALIPDSVVLNSLRVDQKQKKVVLKGMISGGEETAESVLTNFMGNLEDSDFFAEAGLVMSQRSGIIQEFEISCDIVE